MFDCLKKCLFSEREEEDVYTPPEDDRYCSECGEWKSECCSVSVCYDCSSVETDWDRSAG